MEAILNPTNIDERLAEFRAACPHSEIIYDEEIGAILDAKTGELLWVAPPDPALDERQIAEWVGEHRARASAKLAGLEAEKAEWLRKIEAQFDTLIRRKETYIEHLDDSFRPLLTHLAHAELDGRKERTVRIGLLTLRLRKTRARIDVENDQVALEWARIYDPAAIKTSERLLKSEISPELIQKFGPESGLSYYPGGEDELIIE